MPLTTAQYERRRRALDLAAQTYAGGDDTGLLERAETLLAFLEGNQRTNVVDQSGSHRVTIPAEEVTWVKEGAR